MLQGDDGTVIVWSCGEEGRVGLEHPALDVRADDFAFYITDVYGEAGALHFSCLLLGSYLNEPTSKLPQS